MPQMEGGVSSLIPQVFCYKIGADCHFLSLSSAVHRAMAGVVAIFAFIAIIFSVVSVSWCEFVNYTLVKGDNVTVNTVTQFVHNSTDWDLSFSPWRYSSFSLLADSNGHVWKIDTCNSYPSNIDMDAYWKTSQAFSIITPILAVILPIWMCCQPRLGRVFGLLLLVVVACQGLVFLFFKSNACAAGTNPVFVMLDADIDDIPITEGTCQMGTGAIYAILAACLLFVAALIPCICQVEPDEEKYEDHFDSKAHAATDDDEEEQVEVEET